MTEKTQKPGITFSRALLFVLENNTDVCFFLNELFLWSKSMVKCLWVKKT